MTDFSRYYYKIITSIFFPGFDSCPILVHCSNIDLLFMDCTTPTKLWNILSRPCDNLKQNCNMGAFQGNHLGNCEGRLLRLLTFLWMINTMWALTPILPWHLDTVLWAFTLFLDFLESKGSKIGVSVLSSNFQGPFGKVLWAITHFTIPFRTSKV